MTYGFGKLNEYAERCHAYAVKQGFWDDFSTELEAGTVFENATLVLAKLMLIDTETAEAAEAVRHTDIENFGEELADVVIRVMDLAEACNISLEQQIVNKMEKNEKRDRMHGGKRA